MSIRLTQPGAYADLGEFWLRDQLARLTQKRAQFGGALPNRSRCGAGAVGMHCQSSESGGSR